MIGAVNVTSDDSSFSLENRFGAGGMAEPGGQLRGSMITQGKMVQVSGVVRNNPVTIYFVDGTRKWFVGRRCMRCDREGI